MIGLTTLATFYLLYRRVGSGAVAVATSPDWGLLAAACAVGIGIQPLRAWAWSVTLRQPVGFRAVYAASAVGSFLDTVLPGRLGEASKVGVLSLSAGPRWPGFTRAGGSLLCAHLMEMITFALVGAASAAFLPVPGWARATLVAGLVGVSVGLVTMTLLHKRLGHRLPQSVNGFLAGAAAPWPVLARAGAILLTTWLARWCGIFLLLHAIGVHAGLSAALVYMVVTGLANTAPVLPGNAGIYQGAAVGALALVGEAGAKAVAVSVVAPVIASVAAGTAALVGLAIYGRRFAELSRAALVRP